MRKEFVYSFIAMTGAFPVSVLAAPVDANVSVGNEINGDVSVSTGQPLTSTVSLVKGKYTFSVHNSGTNAINVTVAGTLQSVPAGGNANINFEVAEASSVEITISQPDNNAFNFSGATIVLTFDFEEAVANIEKLYQEKLTAIKGYSNDNRDNDVLGINKNVGQKIDAIKNADAENGYQLYVDNKLYDDNALGGLQETLERMSKDALSHEADYLQELLDEQKELYDELTENAKAYVDDKDVNIQTIVNDIKAFNNEEKSSTSVISDINTLKGSIEYAQGLDDNSNTAYQAVVDALDTAQKVYNENTVSLIKLLPKEDETYGTLWTTLLEQGQKELTDLLTELTKIRRENNESKEKGTCVKDEDDLEETDSETGVTVTTKKGYMTRISEAVDSIKKVVTDYTSYKSTITTALGEIKPLKETLKEVEGISDSDVKKLYNTANTLVTNLENAVKAAADKEKVNDATEGVDAKWSNEETGFIAAKNAVDSIKASDAYKNYDAYQTMLTEYNEKLKSLNDIFETVKALSDEVEGYSVGDRWNTWVDNVMSKTFSPIENTIKQQYTNKTAATYKDNTWTTALKTLADSIYALNTNATAAFNRYTTLTEATTGYQTALDELTDAVKDLDIYTKNIEPDLPYKDQIEAIQKRIDKITEAVDAANKLNDTSHLEALQAIEVDSTIATDIENLKENYEEDNGDYLEKIEAEAIAAVTGAIGNLKTEISDGLKEINDKAEDGSYGKAKDEITTEATAIQKRLDEVPDITDDNDRSALDKIANTLYDIKNQLTQLQEKAEQAAAKVDANKAAKEEADKVIAALNTALTEATTQVETNDLDVKDFNEVTDLVTEIKKAIDNAKTAISTAYGEEELNEDTYKEQTDAISQLIKEYQQKADQAQKNYKAYSDLKTLIEAVTTDITTAKRDAKTDEKGDPNNSWTDNLLDIKSTTLGEYRAAINALVEDGYINSDIDANKSGWEDMLKALQDEAIQVPADAKENLEAYNKQQEDIANAYTTYQDAFDYISENDETWGVGDRQNKLLELYAKLTDINTQIVNDYPEGKSRSNKLSEEIADIVAQINAIRAQVEDPDNYNAEVTTQNSAQWEKIKTAYQEAKEAYAKAAETIKSYEAVESDLLKNALEAVKNNVDALNEVLYTFPTDQKTKYANAEKKYTSTTSPDVFDKDGKLLTEAQDLKKAIDDAFDSFISAIKTAVDEDCKTTVDGYNTLYNNVTAAVKAWDKKKYTNSNVSTLFKEAKDLIDNIQVALKDPKLSELDKALKAAEDEQTGVDATIAKIANNQAHEFFGAQLTEIENNAAEWLTEEEQETLAKERNDFNDDYTNGVLYDKYATHKATIDALMKSYKNAKENAADYRDFKANLQTIKKELEDNFIAKYSYADYAAYATLTASDGFIAKIYAELDKLDADLEKAKEDGTVASKKSTYELGYDKKDQPLGLTKTFLSYPADYSFFKTFDELEKAEEAILQKMYDEIQGEYIQYANAQGIDSEATASMKSTIDEKKAELDKLTTDLKGSLINARHWVLEDELLQLEKDFAQLLTDLSNTNDPEAQANALDKVNKALDDVKDNANLDGYDTERFTEEEQTALQEQLDAINEQIAEVEENIESKKDQMVAYEDAIEKQIENINAAVDALKTAADDAQKSYNERKENAEELAKQADEQFTKIQNTIDAAKEEIDGYEYTKADDYQSKFDTLQQQIDELKQEIQDQVDDASLTEENLGVVDGLAETANSTVMDVLNTAANRELNGKLDNLKAQVAAISINENDFTLGDYAKLSAALDEINDSISNSDSGLQKAIADAKTKASEYASYKGLGSYQENEDGESEFVAGDIQKKIDEIQELIDALKQAIEEKKLTQDEPGVEPEPEVTIGDVDGDGEVTDSDVDNFIDALLNGQLPAAGEDNFDTFDANGDGKLTVADAQAILNISLGLNPDGTLPGVDASRNATKVSASLKTTAQQVGGVTRLAFQLDSNTSFNGFQMDVILPAGTTIVAENGQGLTLRSSELANGVHRIVTFGNTIESGNLITIDVQGNGNVQLANVVFTTNDAQSIELAAGAATGINSVLTSSEQGTSYSISGRLAAGWQKGVSIVRDAMGNVKKMIRK